MRSYDHKKIEKKWQKAWEDEKLYETPDKVEGKDNHYLLVEFPYPSGNLHVGHWYAFSVPDIFARFQRMSGKNVLFPIGFDAFGLPAENAAIQRKLNPREWTESNIEYMREQLRSMGASFDWSREVRTIDPEYYRWTQWIFLQFFRKNLVYQKETAVNWCPKDKTVLANEQVVDGTCERCGSEVVQKQMLQWNIKITDYADRLIDDLEPLDWPREIKESQRNWIGRSEGAEVDFPLEIDSPVSEKPNFLILHCYTGRADKNFIPWPKNELESRGYDVQAPQMPHTDNPREDEQVPHVINTCEINERTVIIGHSLGSVVAMKVLQKSDRPVAGLVLVAPAVEPSYRTGDARNFWKTFTWEYDYPKIKSLTNFQLILSDSLEAESRLTYLKFLSQKLSAPLIEATAARKHFTADAEPQVLSCVLPHVTVFTTRPDTLSGATYLVLSPEHPWVARALQHKTVLRNQKEVQHYVEQAAKKTEMQRQVDKDKSGVRLEGVEAVNPVTWEKIPLYVADYVLGHYGTGAIMAVPAHDERDYAFAKRFELPVRQVVAPVIRQTNGNDAFRVNEPVRDRNAVMCIVKHWEKDEYLCQQWNEHPEIKTFISGGIKEGEDIVDAGMREIREESGFTDAKFERDIKGVSFIEFYHQIKKTNIRAKFQYLYYELQSGTQEAIDAGELKKHTIIWKKRDEVRDFLHLLERDAVWDAFEKGGEAPYTGDGVLVNSGAYDGLSVEEAKRLMALAFGRSKKTYKLRDWIVSRQRYWGVPIPIIHCDVCGPQPVPDSELPVRLPEIDDYLPTGDGKSPLTKVDSFVRSKCPNCGGEGRRETDTLDTFVDSSWYFLRYTDPRNAVEFASGERMDAWMPVDVYSGGAEHTTMHLLYSRFWQKAMHDCGLVKDSEPYARRMNRSLILGPDGQKMSKSRGNVIDPDDAVERLGADTVRMYLAFIGPYNEVSSYPWDPNGVVGVRRFLERVVRAEEYVVQGDVISLQTALHKVIKKVGEDIAAQKFNTAISQLMILLNSIEKEKQIGKEQWATLVKLLAPFAPHLAEELWQREAKRPSVHTESWPEYNKDYLVEETITIIVQIDGKTRATVEVPRDAENDVLEAAAREALALKLVEGAVKRVVVVPRRLVNFVT